MAYYAGFLETVNTRKTTVQIANIQMPAGGDAFYKNFIESKIAVDNCWTAGLLDCWTAGLLDCWTAGLLEDILPLAKLG